MKGLLLKDLYVIIKNLKIYLLVSVFFLAAGAMDRSNIFFLYFLPIFGGMIPMTLLAYDEKSGWSQYSLSLPYGRRQIVSSKYMIGLIAQAIMSVLSMTVLFFTGTSFMAIMTFFVSSFSVSCIVPAIGLPFALKFGVEKGRIAYYIVVGACAAIGGILSNTAGDGDTQALPGLAPETAQSISEITVIFTAAAIIIYILSWIISVRIFKNSK